MAEQHPLSLNVSVNLPGFSMTLAEVLPPGSIVCLYGPSGSGKTTTLRVIAGLETRIEGRVALGDRLWHEGKRMRVSPHRRGIGYVVQGGVLFPHRDVRGNLDFVARRARTRGTTFETVVADLGLGSLLSRRLDGLSGGERQRIALGQALLRAPKVMLLDEPLAALDPAAKAVLIPAIRRGVARCGCPTLLVSHDPAEVMALADHVLWIENGMIVEEGGFPDGRGGVALPVLGRVVQSDGNWSLVRAGSVTLWVPQRHPDGTDLRLLMPEGSVLVGRGGTAHSSATGQGEGTLRGVVQAEGRPGFAQMELDCDGVRVTARISEANLASLRPSMGERLRVDILEVEVLG